MTLAWTGDFETGNKSQYSNQESADNATRLVIVSGDESSLGGPSAPGQGSYYLRSVTKNGDNVLGGERAEITSSLAAGPAGGQNGVDYWDYYKIWVAADTMANFAHGELHGQWHSISNDSTDTQANVQAAWFMKATSSWNTVIGSTDANPLFCIGVNGGAGTPYQQLNASTSKLFPLGASKDMLGKWIKFMWHIVWQDTATGTVELWLDDGEGWCKVMEQVGNVANLYDPNYYSYLKLGTNRVQSSGLPDRYVWVDGAKSGTLRSDVDPGHSPVGCWTRGTGRSGGTGTNITVQRPLDTQSGDVMYASLQTETGTTISTVPTGWTLINGPQAGSSSLRVYRKVAGGAEPSTYTFVQSTSTGWASVSVAIAGADTTTPENANAGAVGTAGSATVNAPAVAGINGGIVLDFVIQTNRTAFVYGGTTKNRYRALYDPGTAASGRTTGLGTTKVTATSTVAARTLTDENPESLTLDTLATISVSVKPVPVTTQVAYPVSDVSAGTWSSSTANLFDSIDEVVPDDTDFIYSPLSPVSGVTAEVKLGSLSAPAGGVTAHIKYRYKKNTTGGDNINLTVALVQGTTVIASWVHTGIDAVVDADQALTAPQQASITDWTDLRLRFTAVAA